MVASAISKFAADDAIFSVDTGMCNVWGSLHQHADWSEDARILWSWVHGERHASGYWGVAGDWPTEHRIVR